MVPLNPFLSLRRERPVPESEIEIHFVRSSGPGGQNVNKTSSKAQIRWNLKTTGAFTEREKARLRKALGSKLTKEGEIILSSQSERSQEQNREAAVARLQVLVSRALTPEKKRVPTKPTRSAKRKRLEAKKLLSEKKQSRRFRPDES
jgi:ribosome-associated protein